MVVTVVLAACGGGESEDPTDPINKPGPNVQTVTAVMTWAAGVTRNDCRTLPNCTGTCGNITCTCTQDCSSLPCATLTFPASCCSAQAVIAAEDVSQLFQAYGNKCTIAKQGDDYSLECGMSGLVKTYHGGMKAGTALPYTSGCTWDPPF